jgi:predicted RNA methylase
VQFGLSDVFIDLGAEKIIAAEKAGRIIAVEIKSFLNTSIITDFHLAVGQILNYRVALEQQDPSRILYLAVPVDTYSIFFFNQSRKPLSNDIICAF